MEAWRPAMIAPRSTPWLIRLITSDSAKTVHIALIRCGSWPSACFARLSTWTPRACPIVERKRPVPAAHLSFMTKSSTWPSAESRIPFASCPPISITNRQPGTRYEAPRAWQVISVGVRVAFFTVLRPYPVVATSLGGDGRPNSAAADAIRLAAVPAGFHEANVMGNVLGSIVDHDFDGCRPKVDPCCVPGGSVTHGESQPDWFFNCIVIQIIRCVRERSWPSRSRSYPA